MYKTIKKMLNEMRDKLIEEIARNRKVETDDLKDEISDLYDLADNERDRQLSHPGVSRPEPRRGQGRGSDFRR